jgi:hypothetical protein
MAFPTTLPSYTVTVGSETLNGAAGGTGLSGLLNAFETDLVALGTKMGTGAATPSSGRVLRGNGAGTSTWGQVVMASDMAAFSSADILGVVSDETGTGSLVFGTSPTIVTPTIASFTNAQHNHSNAAGGGQLDYTAFPVGTPVQMVATSTSAAATGTTLIPEDDTLPQNTEGDQYMTLAITPKATTNRLFITVKAFLSPSTAGTNDIISALFQDSVANGLAATDMTTSGTSFMVPVTLTHDMPAGTTSATTFKFRAGLVLAGTLTFNGFGGVRKFGGATLSTMSILEYKA